MRPGCSTQPASTTLRDPYALGADGQQTAVGDGQEAYFKALDLPGTDMMARVRIPAIDVDLPVFHGTDDAILARGIGHLFGSGLPVGGAGTHAVLTGHSGFVQAKLFDDLDDLVEGDTVVVTVLGEDLYYEVDQIATVLPGETERLRQVPGQDHLTLVTCTPTGVNTHRLLVRTVRVDAPTAEQTRTVVDDSGPSAGFPWWAVFLIGGLLAAFAAVKPRRARSDRAAARRGGAAGSPRMSPPS
jgi:sortase A